MGTGKKPGHGSEGDSEARTGPEAQEDPWGGHSENRWRESGHPAGRTEGQTGAGEGGPQLSQHRESQRHSLRRAPL